MSLSKIKWGLLATAAIGLLTVSTPSYASVDGTGFNDLDVDGGVGYALQAGFDYWLNENWGLNMDVKYIDLNVDVAVNNGPRLHARDVDLDPWIFGVGVSYRF